MEFTYITKEQMAEVDRLALEYGLTVQQMMENAGRVGARFVADLNPNRVVCLYGKGNNGGDALCCARHLLNYGIEVRIVAAFEGEGNENVEHQLGILEKMGVKNEDSIGDLSEGDVIVDGLLGYNLSGSPRGRFALLIEHANSLKDRIRIVSYDIPSGMDADTSKKREPCIEADYVVTLALPFVGLRNFKELWLGDIGIPRKLYEELGIEIGNYFKEGDCVKIE